MPTTHGPVVVRRRLGAVLKQLRGQQGLHLDVVARQLEISPSKLSRLETGQVEPKVRDVRDLLDIYHAEVEVREQVMQWTAEAKSPGWWQEFTTAVGLADLDMFISLETEARSERMFSLPVAGLLQTEAYARALLSGAFPDASTAELSKLIAIRVGRQAVLEPYRSDASPLELHAVLDECALHRTVAGRAVMVEQYRELLTHSHRPNVTLQILPFSAGFTRATSTFAIFEPRDPVTDWPVVNVESAGSDAYFDTANEVSIYQTIWRDVLAKALSPDASRDLVHGLLRS